MVKKKLMAMGLLVATIVGVGSPSITHAASESTAKKQEFMESGVGKNIATKHRDSKGYTIGYTYKIKATSDIIEVHYTDGVVAYIDYSEGKLQGVTNSNEPVDEKEWSNAEIKSPYRFQSGAKGTGSIEDDEDTKEDKKSNKNTDEDEDKNEDDNEEEIEESSANTNEKKKQKLAESFVKSKKWKKMINEIHDGSWDWTRYEGDDYLYVRWDDDFEATIDYNTGEVLNTESAEERAEKKAKKNLKKIKAYMESGKGKNLAESRADGKGKGAKFTWESDGVYNSDKQIIVHVTFDDGYTMDIDYKHDKILSEASSINLMESNKNDNSTEVNLGTDSNPSNTKAEEKKNDSTETDSNKETEEEDKKDSSIIDKALDKLGLTSTGTQEGGQEKVERLEDEAEELKQFQEDAKKFMQGEGKTLAEKYKDKDGKTPEYVYATDKLRNQIVIKYADDHLVTIDFKTKQIVNNNKNGAIVFNPNIGTTMVNGYAVPNYIMNTDNSALNEKEIFMKTHGDPAEYEKEKYPITEETLATKVTTTGKVRSKHPEGKTSTWYQGKYYDSEGYNVIGWKEVDGIYYHFDTNGDLDRGPKEIDGKKYLLSSIDGAMCTGWQVINDKYYYFNQDGSMKTGWVKQGNMWYYLSDDGTVSTGWFEADGKKYHSNNKGVLQTGWFKENGNYYFLGTDGALKTEQFEHKGKIYTPDSNGVCFKA